jgi:hypothetical protein
MVCRSCESEVPEAEFCGICGAAQHRNLGPHRIRAYAAAPSEHTLLPSVATSLFPHLPRRSLLPFRAGLALVFLSLTAFALLRWQPPLITVGALGFPILFLLYLHQSEVDDDLPRSSLVLTAAMGIVLGVGWAFVTNELVDQAYELIFVDGQVDRQVVLDALSALEIPVGFAVLMLIPAVVIRLVRPGTREPLDGFVIGSLGGISFTAAWNLTRMAPEFQTGITANDWPVVTLVLQAGIQVIAVPLATAALSGLVGVALWSGRRGLIFASLLVTLALYVGIGMIDFAEVVPIPDFALYFLVAAVAVIVLRIGVQTALMGERHEPLDPAARVLCPHCETVVPDMPFCPNCGFAAPAGSRTSRTARRVSSDEDVVAARGTSGARLLTGLGIGLAVIAAGGVAAAVVLTPAAPQYVCPPDCGRPPIAEPIESNPRFVSPDGAFSVQYPGPGTAYEATLAPDGVDLKFTGGDTGTMGLFGRPAHGRTPKQIAEDVIGESYPNSTIDYQIPNAMVGYEPGYGAVLDEYPQDANSAFNRSRLIVLVAIKHDYALIAAAIGPYHQFTRDNGPGHPSGANLQLAMDMGKYVNSFRWNESAQ